MAELTQKQLTALRWRYGRRGVRVVDDWVQVQVQTVEGKTEWAPFGRIGSVALFDHPIFSEPPPSIWTRIRMWWLS